MTRCRVNVTDRTAKRTRRFEGVDITWLVLAEHQSYGNRTQVTVETLREEGVVSGERSDLDALEVSFGFFHKKRIPGRNLDANSKVIILDTVSGRILRRYAPFSLVIELEHGRRLLFRHVTRVAIRPSV
jgi:hypothetical protein